MHYLEASSNKLQALHERSPVWYWYISASFLLVFLSSFALLSWFSYPNDLKTRNILPTYHCLTSTRHSHWLHTLLLSYIFGCAQTVEARSSHIYTMTNLSDLVFIGDSTKIVLLNEETVLCHIFPGSSTKFSRTAALEIVQHHVHKCVQNKHLSPPFFVPEGICIYSATSCTWDVEYYIMLLKAWDVSASPIISFLIMSTTTISTKLCPLAR